MCLTRGRWKSEVKVKLALLHLWKRFFLLNNKFSQFNHAAYHIETEYMIPGLVLGLFLGGESVSMGVYRFYLGAHKSGKKEKYIPSSTIYYTQSLSWLKCSILNIPVLTWSSRGYYLTSTRSVSASSMEKFQTDTAWQYWTAIVVVVLIHRSSRGSCDWSSCNLCCSWMPPCCWRDLCCLY